jgi:hypothetical protein
VTESELESKSESKSESQSNSIYNALERFICQDLAESFKSNNTLQLFWDKENEGIVSRYFETKKTKKSSHISIKLRRLRDVGRLLIFNQRLVKCNALGRFIGQAFNRKTTVPQNSVKPLLKGIILLSIYIRDIGCVCVSILCRACVAKTSEKRNFLYVFSTCDTVSHWKRNQSFF